MFKLFPKTMSKSDRQAVMRFNKISLEHARAFRADLGGLIAKNAAKGLLKSSYTIKGSYAVLQSRLDQIVDESLQLVSNRTRHSGRERKRLLGHVRDQVHHQAKNMNQQIDEVIFKRVGPGGDAEAAAEVLWRECLAAALDRVDKYEDGLTAPVDQRWHDRHPIIMIVIAGMIGALITYFSGLLD
jgi:hypothetical protein